MGSARLSRTELGATTARDIAAVVAPVVFVGAFAVATATQGLYTQRAQLWLWLLAGMAAFSVRGWQRWPRMVLDWLPLLAFLMVYDFARGAADGEILAAHRDAQIAFDEALGGGALPTTWLQEQLYTIGHPRWYDFLVWLTYVSHFFVPWATLAVLWRVNADRFRAFRNRLVAMSFAACGVFFLFPTMPPWMTSGIGETEHVSRLIGHLWSRVGLERAEPLFASPHVGNLVAAVPSLHAAYPCLLLFFFWSAGRVVRGVLAGYTLAMGFTLVYGGEHFVFDVLAGWMLAGATMAAFAAAPRLRAELARRRDPDPTAQH